MTLKRVMVEYTSNSETNKRSTVVYNSFKQFMFANWNRNDPVYRLNILPQYTYGLFRLKRRINVELYEREQGDAAVDLDSG